MRFGYTILYVDDVARAIDFYERAFGLTCRFVADDATYGEMGPAKPRSRLPGTRWSASPSPVVTAAMTRRSHQPASRSASSRTMFPLPGRPRSRPGRPSSRRPRPNRGGKPSPMYVIWMGCWSRSAPRLQASSIVRRSPARPPPHSTSDHGLAPSRQRSCRHPAAYRCSPPAVCGAPDPSMFPRGDGRVGTHG